MSLLSVLDYVSISEILCHHFHHKTGVGMSSRSFQSSLSNPSESELHPYILVVGAKGAYRRTSTLASYCEVFTNTSCITLSLKTLTSPNSCWTCSIKALAQVGGSKGCYSRATILILSQSPYNTVSSTNPNRHIRYVPFGYYKSVRSILTHTNTLFNT